jgi:uncharacterized membrane protein
LSDGEFTTFDVPESEDTHAFGINITGQIVGVYNLGITHFRHDYAGFLLDNGQFTTIDFPGAFGTAAHGINAAGQIVGSNPEARHGFLLSEGEFTTIQINSANTAALGINSDGLIVGAFQPDYHDHGFLAIPR